MSGRDVLKNPRIALKSADDIRRIRDSGSITADVFRRLSEIPLAGLSTWDVDSIIESSILKQKGRPAFKTVAGYSASSCISINDEVVHGLPSKKRKIKSGDLVKIDTGVVLNGFFSDACRTFTVGEVTPSAQKLADAARISLEQAIGAIRPGGRVGDIGAAIQEYAESQGYSVVRNYTGHGVGFALHEPPVVPHYGKKGTGFFLEPGLVIAIEPMINDGGYSIRLLDDGWTAVTADGSLSAHFEQTIAITADGPLILTD